ncbi:MAG: glycine--tRNA ligase [Thermoplasmata archaeon]
MSAPGDLFSRVMALAKRRGFLWPSFEIYGGAGGFYDYGPLGCRLKSCVEELWREYYVRGEGFAELSAPAIAPEIVFRASGHLDKFSDIMVECSKCGEAFRADHLLRETSGGMPPAELEEISRALKESRVRCPECGGALSEPFPFNLMFRTSIGPGVKRTGYLRPETAQAMFLDFGLLYRYFREKLPFGVVQLGRGYRNEIAPRQGLIRLREFNMAEAEIFLDPEEKAHHPRFSEVRDMGLRLLPDGREEMLVRLGEAVASGLIGNEWVAYYMGLTARFLLDAGVDPERLRFRQHARSEMAHYAADCWDAEALLSFGWTELVGIADRTCYDLEAHMRHSGVDLRAFARYEKPRTVEKRVVAPNHAVLGPRYRKDAKAIAAALEALEPASVDGRDEVELEVEGRKLRVASDCFTIKKVTVTESGRWFTPHVIEPSYGIDRIIYTILEHAYTEGKATDREHFDGRGGRKKERGEGADAGEGDGRTDMAGRAERDGNRRDGGVGGGGETGEGVSGKDNYVVLKLKPAVAPIQVAVFPLINRAELVELANEIERGLRSAGLRTHTDATDSIGRRYARMDEVGTPFCVTADFDTLQNGTVTVRDRDTTKQVRRGKDGLADFIHLLIAGRERIE